MARRRPVAVDGGGCVSDVDTLEFVSLGSKNISRPTGPLLSPGQALGSGRSTQRRGTARHGRIAGQVWSGRYAVQFVTLACTLSFRHQQNSVSKSFPGRHLEIPNHLVTVSNPRQITTTGLFPSREGKKKCGEYIFPRLSIPQSRSFRSLCAQQGQRCWPLQPREYFVHMPMLG